MRCALPLAGDRDNEAICIACATQPDSALDWCGAWGLYESGLERVLHAFKFERHDFLAPHLAALLAEHYRPPVEPFDVVTAIPMHPAKQRRRGFNQAALLGRELSRRLTLPFNDRLLVKKRNNTPQSTLPRDERKGNVRGVFGASAEADGKAILVIDDISTTGETLREAAAELKRGGASRVGAMVVARVRDARP